MAPRLKVFVTSDGLTDFAVAATSRAKALAAWGVRQDLFKEGLARESDDPELTAAAVARPGEVQRRPARGRAELARAAPARRPAPRSSATAGSKAVPPEAASQPKAPPRPKPPSKAARRKVEELERRLREADAAFARASAELDRARGELERRAEALAADHAARRAALEQDLTAARRALVPPAQG